MDRSNIQDEMVVVMFRQMDRRAPFRGVTRKLRVIGVVFRQSDGHLIYCFPVRFVNVGARVIYGILKRPGYSWRKRTEYIIRGAFKASTSALEFLKFRLSQSVIK